MSACPKCAHENEDVDFCVNCGTYLRWDPTRIQPAVKPPEPAPPPPAPVQEPPAGAPPVLGGAAAAAAPPPPAAPAPPAPAAEPPPAAPPPPPPPVELPAQLMRTMDMPVVRAGDPRADPASGVPSLLTAEAVQITLTYPESADAEEKLVVEAGGRVVLPALIRNQSGIVDNYEIRVEGMPAEWWNVTPPAVYLVPFGAPNGTYEQEVQIHFAPPRSAEAEARIWEIEVVAISKAQGEQAGSTRGKVQITPYEDLVSELRPELVTGRRKAGFALMVRNLANAPIDTEITAVDSQNACKFDFEKSRFVADPGRRDGTTFIVRPKKPLIFGRSTDRRFEITAKAAAGASSARPLTGVFRQKPWIPYWVPIVVPALIAAAVLIWTLIPHRTTVPNLRGRSQAAAAILLQKAHLKLASGTPAEVPSKRIKMGHVVGQLPLPGAHVKQNTMVTIRVAEPLIPDLLGKTQQQAALLLQQRGLALSSQLQKKISKKPAGTVIEQIPGAGRPARTGTQVAIVVAVGTGLRKVPNVVGMTLPAAETAVRAAGLSVQLPTLAPTQNPAKVVISTQIPSAGQTVKANVPVQLYVPAPPKPKPTTAPVVAGLSAAAAAAALSKQGAVPVIVREFNVAKAGTVISQTPPANAPVKSGEKVTIVVSAGYPEIAFSDGKDVLEMWGGTGNPVKAIAATSQIEEEPSWQPGGSLVAYRRGPSSDAGAIWTTDVSRGSGSARRMTAGPDDRRPAFSPDGKVIAFIRRTPTSTGGTDGDLCFVRTGSTLHQGVCITDPKLSVDRPAWSPDGRSILVVAVDATDPNQTELGLYTSATPDSASPVDWTFQGLVTDKLHGKRPGEGVLYAAFSPDGTQVAIVANWGATNLSLFRIFLASWSNGQLGTPKAVVPSIRACEVSWLSDSKELAVTQADDCSTGTGAISRVSPATSGTVTTLRSADAQNPAWQPVPLG